MSDYTITLKRICDVYGKEEVLGWFKSYSLYDYLTIEEVSVIGYHKVFKTDVLAEMILNRYFFREIAFETPEMFKHYAITKLREIMRKICSFNLFSFTCLQSFRSQNNRYKRNIY